MSSALAVRTRGAVESLTPGYFALVMGSGIISVGLELESFTVLSRLVLAGARIVEMADAPMVHVTRDLIAGLAVIFWAFATWLIPVLVAAGWWRHVARQVPLRYEATLWSIIFPLGMYAVAGIYLGEADNLPVVALVGRLELWVALAAWIVVLVAMARHLLRTVVLGDHAGT